MDTMIPPQRVKEFEQAIDRTLSAGPIPEAVPGIAAMNEGTEAQLKQAIQAFKESF